jgi:hypothetical protein
MMTLGILLVHGIGTQRRGDTLIRIGNAIHAWLRDWLHHADVEIADAKLAPEKSEGDAPAHARIFFGQDDQISSLTWHLAESHWADTFPAPSYLEFVRWVLGVVPSAIVLHLVHRFRAALEMNKAYADARKSREDPRLRIIPVRTFIDLLPHVEPRLRERLLDNPSELGSVANKTLWKGLVSWLLLPVFVIAGLLIQIVLALLLIVTWVPIGFVRSFARWIEVTLSASLGDSYLFTSSPVIGSAIVTRVQRDIEWLANHEDCDHVVVIAHSQGAAVAYKAIQEWAWQRRLPPKLKLLITYGSGLRKLFDLEHALDRSVWGPRKVDRGGDLKNAAFRSFGSSRLGRATLTLSLALTALVVLLVMGKVSPLWGIPGVVIVYLALGRVFMIAAEMFHPHPALLPVEWDDLYSAHDPVPNGPIRVREGGVQEIGRVPGESVFASRSDDPVNDFYFRQRDVVNRRSALSDHTGYWSSPDDFVARIVVRLMEVSGFSLHSLTLSWLEASSWRRLWRVRLLSGCRAVAATAMVAVGLLWLWAAPEALRRLGHPVEGLIRAGASSVPDVLGVRQWVTSSSVPGSLAGAAFLVLGVALVFAVAQIGWSVWNRRECGQFFLMCGYRAHVIGATVFALGWMGLIASPVIAALLLGTAARALPVSPLWISLGLLVISAGLVLIAGKPPAGSTAWALNAVETGERLLGDSSDDKAESLDKAQFRLKMGAVLLTGRRHVDVRVRAVIGWARAMEQSNRFNLGEVKVLIKNARETTRTLDAMGRDSASVREVLERTEVRKSRLEAAAKAPTS